MPRVLIIPASLSRIVGLVVAAGLVVAGCAEDGADSAVATNATTVSTTTATTTGSQPAATTVAPSTAPTTAPAPTPRAPIPVNATIQPPADPQVLYEASVGAAVDELGMEDCTECDPTRPLNPVVTPDGRVVIVDAANSRWVIVTAGVPAAVPLPPDVRPDAVLMGPGDVVYLAAASVTSQGPTGSQLLAFDANQLDVELARHAISTGFSQPWLRLDGDEVVVMSSEPEQRFPLVRATTPPLHGIEQAFEAEPPTLTVTDASGGTHQWQFDRRQAPTQAIPLGNGSVAVIGSDDLSLSAPKRVVYLLRPDGSSAARHLAAMDASFDGGLSLFVDEHGVVILEHAPDAAWRVVRFPPPA